MQKTPSNRIGLSADATLIAGRAGPFERQRRGYRRRVLCASLASFLLLLSFAVPAVGQTANVGWEVVYVADTSPPPTFNTDFPGAEGCSGVVEVLYGLLHGNTVESSGTCLWVNFWDATAAGGFAIETRVKILRGGGYLGLGFAFWGSVDATETVLILGPDQIVAGPEERVLSMSTTDNFHVYRMTVSGGTYRIYVDGLLGLEGPTDPGVTGGRHFTGFGDGSGVSNSDYLLDYFSFTTQGGFSPDELPSPAPLTVLGFYHPVDMGAVLNTVKNGATVPLKFEVFAGATAWTDTSVVKSLSLTQVACDTGLPTDAIEITTTGGTSLRYDTTTGQFVYNWQTPKMRNTCWDVALTVVDGSSITAHFKLR